MAIYFNFITEIKVEHLFIDNKQMVNNDFKQVKLVEDKLLVEAGQGAVRAEFVNESKDDEDKLSTNKSKYVEALEQHGY